MGTLEKQNQPLQVEPSFSFSPALRRLGRISLYTKTNSYKQIKYK